MGMHIFTHLSPQWQGKTGFGIYADGMAEHDSMVGQLLAKLRELGIEDNTIVMYSTDNGSESFGMKVWQEPFVALRAPMLTNLRMDPFELAADIGMDYERWFAEHMFLIAPRTVMSASGCRASANSRRARSPAASTSTA